MTKRAAGMPSLETQAEWISGYRPDTERYDEMMDSEGRIRPHWQQIIGTLAELGVEAIEHGIATADQFLRDSGVFYKNYDAGVDRPWPLSHVPLILPFEEWRLLEAGLSQRADLLEEILTDVYGPASLIKSNILPAAFAAGNPSFLRPMTHDGSKGSHIHIYAADVGRAQDGRWHILRDRTQAPSGLGYAIENRLAMRHGFAELHRDSRTLLLAPFFRTLKHSLESIARYHDARIGMLTPGETNDAYFEHAFLARYLGIQLVEGADLVVQNDGVYVRNIDGLQRLDVLVRRVDGDFIDPLELNSRSHIGTAGILQAVRNGTIAIANSVGAGFAEARGLAAFLPAIAQRKTGPSLAIPGIATYWFGSPHDRNEIARQINELAVAPAYFDDLPSAALDRAVRWDTLSPRQKALIESAIADRPQDFVAQKPIQMSTMPVWRNGRLLPCPFTLRIFLIRTKDGWNAMPGGFVRLHESGAQDPSIQTGAVSADVWIPSNVAVTGQSLLPVPEEVVVRRDIGPLSSRAADNFYWLGRYLERLDSVLRLVQALLSKRDQGLHESEAIARIKDLLVVWNAVPEDLISGETTRFAQTALASPDCNVSAANLAASLTRAATSVRNNLSTDLWSTINRIANAFGPTTGNAPPDDDVASLVDSALSAVASISGHVQENMSRTEGWHFLQIGRRVERAIAISRFSRQFLLTSATMLDTLLDLCDSNAIYRQRYMMVFARNAGIDLVILDPSNPRSVIFQLDRIGENLDALPPLRTDNVPTRAQRLVLKISGLLRSIEAVDLTEEILIELEDMLMVLSDAISDLYLGPAIQDVNTGD